MEQNWDMICLHCCSFSWGFVPPTALSVNTWSSHQEFASIYSDCPRMSHTQQIFRVRNLMLRTDSFSTNPELLSQEILDFRNFWVCFIQREPCLPKFENKIIFCSFISLNTVIRRKSYNRKPQGYQKSTDTAMANWNTSWFLLTNNCLFLSKLQCTHCWRCRKYRNVWRGKY